MIQPIDHFIGNKQEFHTLLKIMKYSCLHKDMSVKQTSEQEMSKYCLGKIQNFGKKNYHL